MHVVGWVDGNWEFEITQWYIYAGKNMACSLRGNEKGQKFHRVVRINIFG